MQLNMYTLIAHKFCVFFRITDHNKIQIGEENRSIFIIAKNKWKDLQMPQNVTLWLHHNGN